MAGYDPTGAPSWGVTGANIRPWVGARLADGGAIWLAGAMARYRADGTEMWRSESMRLAYPSAVDEVAGVVWASVPVPTGTVVTVGAATVGDCDRAPGTYDSTTLVARLDLATGALLDVRLVAEGLEIRQMSVRDDGSLLVVGRTHTHGDPAVPEPEIELCGLRVMPDVGAAAELVVAAIE